MRERMRENERECVSMYVWEKKSAEGKRPREEGKIKSNSLRTA